MNELAGLLEGTYEGTVEIERVVTARVKLSVRDWQLFSDMEGVEEAAGALNRAASAALSSGDPETAWHIFQKAQIKWQKFGAWDTEPRGVFRELVEEVFPGSGMSW